ncbi:MAG: HAMP domain-containing protein [Anaerolineae bacterium]|nr:HAMP domain-containing protein [Anaerolineae bacterium]
MEQDARVRVVPVLLALISLLVAILVAVFLTRSIARPIRQLSEAADSVRLGNWDVTVPGTPCCAN